MRKDITQLFDEFMYECEFIRKSRPQTLRGYRQTFALLMKLLPHTSTDTLTTPLLITFFRTLEQRKRVVGRGIVKTGIRKSTVATYWSKLNNFFEWLKLKGHIEYNPFANLPYPTPVYEDRKFLKKEDIEKIFTAILIKSNSSFILKRNLALFHVLLFCGLRREELVLLQVRDIDFDRKMLTVRGETSKVNRTRYIPLHSQVIMHLKDYIQERKRYSSQYLFVSSTRDRGMSIPGLEHLAIILREASGVSFTFHQFRHTFAVNFLKASNNIAKLKQLMGHKDISMTILYLRCLPTNEMRGDIESMRIDNFI